MKVPQPGGERATLFSGRVGTSTRTATASTAHFFLVKMLIGVAATTLGAAPLALRLWLSDFDDVKFIGSTVLFGVVFLCILLLCLIGLAYTRDTNIECLIARASLAPGALNTIVFSAAPVATIIGERQW